MIFTILFSIIPVIAKWFIFRKMGRQGWEAIIPVYSTYVLFEELYDNGWKFLLLLVPLYNIYVFVKQYIDLARKFGRSTAFGWGLILLNPIFLCILAFSKDAQCDEGENVDFIGDVTEHFTHNENKDAESLLKYKQLLDDGAISEDEFSRKKEAILSR